MNQIKLVLFALGCIGLSGCGEDDGPPSDPVTRDYSAIFSPLPFMPPYPEDNQYNASKEQLGELLYWDPILSGDQNVACASCHHPDFGWADGRALSVGSDGLGLGPPRSGSQLTSMHSPTIMNVAFTGMSNGVPGEDFVSGGYFWDLRAQTLEEQVLGPIQNPVEMLGYNVNSTEIINEIVLRLQAIPEYVELFELSFASEEVSNASDLITGENIAKAIATFERKVITPDTRFDRFLGGESTLFSEREVVGLNKFIDAGCSRCHSGPMLSDNLMHDNESVINGRVVRTPTLRNISFTAPYMHDGSRVGLIDAIAEYEDRDDLQVSLDDGDFGDIEAFLRTLNTENFYRGKPDSVPSGLPVGGDIN